MTTQHCSAQTSRKPYHCITKPEYRVQVDEVDDGEWLACPRHLAVILFAAFREDGKAIVTPLDPDDWRWRN